MSWTIRFDASCKKELKKLDHETQKLIINYLVNKILKLNHPKHLGKQLRYGLKEYWRYRISKYRIICKLQEDVLTILVIKIGNRDIVYD